MGNWYVFTLAALFMMGTQRFLYKVSAEREYSTAWTTFCFMATVTSLSAFSFLLSDERVSDTGFLMVIGLFNGVSFAGATMSHMEALKHLPAGVAYPIIRLNVVIVIIFSVLFFKDPLSFRQVSGIVLAVGVIYLFAKDVGHEGPVQRHVKRGLVLAFISLFSGAAASVSSKFAAMHTNPFGFMTISYGVATLFSLGLTWGRNGGRLKKGKGAAMTGFLMGAINFGGFYFFLKALSVGPLSIIVSVMGLHFFVAIILSVLIYKERLTSVRTFGVILTTVSIILVRF